jgi:hypothetical protein
MAVCICPPALNASIALSDKRDRGDKREVISLEYYRSEYVKTPASAMTSINYSRHAFRQMRAFFSLRFYVPFEQPLTAD